MFYFYKKHKFNLKGLILHLNLINKVSFLNFTLTFNFAAQSIILQLVCSNALFPLVDVTGALY